MNKRISVSVRTLVIIVAIAITVFFLEPLSVTNMMYNHFFQPATESNYNSDFHYGVYFPTDFRAAEDYYTGDTWWKCPENGTRTAIGSIVKFECPNQKPIYYWAWTYELRYGDVKIFLGYEYLWKLLTGQSIYNPI